MTKKFEDMTPEEKKEVFNKWMAARSKANDDPITYLVDMVTEALNPYIPAADQDDAAETLKEELEEVFSTIEVVKE